MKRLIVCFALLFAVCSEIYAIHYDSFYRVGLEKSWSKTSSGVGGNGLLFEIGESDINLRMLYDYTSYETRYNKSGSINNNFQEHIIYLGLNRYFHLNRSISPYFGCGFADNILNSKMVNSSGNIEEGYDTYTYSISELGIMFNMGIRFETYNITALTGVGGFIEARVALNPSPIFSRSYFVVGGYIKF